MPIAFEMAWAKASQAIDTCFGDLFLYAPMLKPDGGGRAVADPDRAATTITGALTENPVFVYPETRSRRASVVAQEATQDMTIDIAADALPFDPQSGDRLTRLSVAGVPVANGAVYQVNGTQPDGMARIVLRVFKLAASS